MKRDNHKRIDLSPYPIPVRFVKDCMRRYKYGSVVYVGCAMMLKEWEQEISNKGESAVEFWSSKDE